MSEKKQVEKNAGTEDPELDELLNSALEDFSKKPSPQEGEDTAAVANLDKEAESKWTDEYLKEASAQFENNMAEIMAKLPSGMTLSPDLIQQNVHKMAEAAAEVISNPQPTEQSSDFAATISQTLQNLSLGAENLQTPGMFPDQNLMSMFGALGGEEGENAFLPMMQGMMQSLMSKEVLYPCMKDMLDTYPAWLEKNKDKLETDQYERYVKQQELIAEVCATFEQENENDPEDVQRDRFNKVLSLMQKMQDLGQPPSELVGENDAGIQLDAQGNPVLPDGLNLNDPSQCTVM